MFSASWRIGRTDSFINCIYDVLRQRLNKQLVNLLLNKIGAQSKKCVLEAGSGTAFGTYVFSCEEGVSAAIALDHDMSALVEARKRKQNLLLVVGNINGMPFKENSFDLTWNNSTIEHLDNISNALNEMKRVTKKNGHIFIGVPYQYGPFFFQPWIRNTIFGKWIGKVFSKQGIGNEVRRLMLNLCWTGIYFFGMFVGVLAKKHE